MAMTRAEAARRVGRRAAPNARERLAAPVNGFVRRATEVDAKERATATVDMFEIAAAEQIAG